MENKTSPWLTVWTAPRRTIRSYLESSDPGRNALWLSIIAGFSYSLNRASSNNTGDDMSLLMILLVSLIGGGIGGLLMFYLGSPLLRITGSWLGGKGTTPEIKVALARGVFMPSVLIALMWIPELLLVGKELFTAETPNMDSNILILVLYLLCIFVELVFGVWAMVVGLKAIGEAHRFSAWKALICMILPALMLVVLMVVLVVLIGLFF
ncbi:YIP1 family protein [Paenibacillus sp. sgz500958]|uniref:YIP1 family protein n=1 Tax=Paenibacillus sp. sgz500958 TaxID=3242475 RepID=UPI0036D38712